MAKKFGAIFKQTAQTNNCIMHCITLGFTIPFGMVLFQTWRPCFLVSEMTNPQPTNDMIISGYAYQQTIEQWTEDVKLTMNQDYRLEEDVAAGLSIAAMVGFFGNLICLIYWFCMGIFVQMATVKRLFTSAKCRRNAACLPCCIQIAILIIVPLCVFNEKVEFCSGITYSDPTSVAAPALVMDQVSDKRETMRKVWIAELVLFFTGCYILCCVDMCIMIPKMAKLGSQAAQANGGIQMKGGM